MGKVRAKLDEGAIVWTIFIYVVHITSIQIFSLMHCYLSTTPAPILSWAYFITPAISFNSSDSMTILWLAATLARINKRKWSLEKEKIKQNLNEIAENFTIKKILYIQGSPAPCQQFFPYKRHTQTFLTFQSKWAPEEELCLNNISAFRSRYSTKFELFELWIQMSSLFIHVTNFKITITNLNSKLCIYYLKYWHFLNNWVSNFLEERSSTICSSSPYNSEMKNWNQEVRSRVLYYTTFHKT